MLEELATVSLINIGINIYIQKQSKSINFKETTGNLSFKNKTTQTHQTQTDNDGHSRVQEMRATENDDKILSY